MEGTVLAGGGGVDDEGAIAGQDGIEVRAEGRGRAHRLGWGFFLAFVALTPLIIGALPSKAGWLAQFSAYDSVNLPKAVAFLVLSGISLAALCVSVARRESDLYWHPVLWILVALFGWAVISTVFSPSPWLSVWGSYYVYAGLVAIFGYGLVAFLAIQYVRSARELRVVMATAVVSGLLVSVYALMQAFELDPFSWGGGETSRVFSTFGNANMLGDYLVFPFALALGLALSSSRRRSSVAWLSAAVLIASALLATSTRGAWLGASVVLLCLAIAGWRGVRQASFKRRLLFAGLVVVTIVALVALATFVRPNFAGRPLTLSSGLERLSNGRSLVWLAGLRAWLAHPITGWGPGAFVRAFESARGAASYTSTLVGRTADDAHNFLVQALVTLGIPGLVLTVWALVQTLIQSFRGMTSATGRERLLSVALWGALLGMMTALTFGVSLPDVVVWLWLTVGLLLVPTSRRLRAVPTAVPAAASALGVVLALWAGSWLVADGIVGRALKLEAGPGQVSALETAVRLNPLSQNYRLLVAGALVNEGFARQRAGQSPQVVDETMSRAIAAYEAATAADRGDVFARIGLANLLVSSAQVHPDSDAAQRAVSVALGARRLAPQNAEVLVGLARAYQAAGRLEEAEKTAQLARSIAPAYSMQTLGSLGLDAAPAP